MFTGLVEELGHISLIEHSTDGARIVVSASIVTSDIAKGDSIAVNGVCLTALDVTPNSFAADVSPETLDRTTIGNLAIGSSVNLERALLPTTRLGGHIMQGHVDGRGTFLSAESQGDFWTVKIGFPDEFARYLVHKGSVAVEGISLTIAALNQNDFDIAVIPKTWEMTNPVSYTHLDVYKRQVFDTAERAGDFFVDATDTVGTNAKRVARVVGFGSSVSTTMEAGMKSAKKAVDWAKEDPMRAATTGASMAIGAGLGIIFTGISSHWLLNSAIPTFTVKKLAESFDGYLKRREELIDKGALNQADAERIAFERDIAKRIGAPLLGAFSFASGAVMMTNVLNPATVTGFPLGNIIGGNPLLEGVWFFGNGMVCFKTSYDFFMIALDGQEDVEKMVKEIKGLLPSAA